MEICYRTINFHYSCLKSKNTLICNLVKFAISDDGAQSLHGRNIRFMCGEYDLQYSSFSCIHCHRQMTSLFHNNQYARCHDFDVSRFTVLLDRDGQSFCILLARDGQSFSNDEIDFIINDICTQ